MKKPNFKREFKIEAAELVLDSGYSVKEASESLGVSNGAIRNWVKQLEKERQGQTPKNSKAFTEEHIEIQKLKKQVKQLEIEKDILKPKNKRKLKMKKMNQKSKDF